MVIIEVSGHNNLFSIPGASNEGSKKLRLSGSIHIQF